MKKLLVFCLSLFLALPASAGIVSYERMSDNAFLFKSDGAEQVVLQLCSPSVVKVYYSFDGKFIDGQPTPAVVSDIIEPHRFDVNEDQAQYEIFTGVLRISVEKDPFRIRIYDIYQKVLVSDAQDAYRDESGVVSCTKNLARDEQIFGLGEKGGLMNRRGGYFTMWNSDKPCYCIDEDPLYKSIPFFMSSKGYGIFFDNSYKTHFDFGTTARDKYSFSAEGGEMIYYIIAGQDYKDILAKYIALTGKPVMPPKWALGYSQCRGSFTREDQALEIASKFRELQIPCDIIYQDIGWTEYLQNFNWRPRNYHDPRGMLGKLTDMGYHVIVSQDPVISQPNKVQWHEADSLGYLVKDVRTGKTYDMPWPWGGRCGVVDFTNPEVASWWGDLQQKPIDDGVSGFWTDMGEPAWSNEDAPERLNMMHFAGEHAKIHNVYGLYWDRVVTEEFYRHNPDRRLFQMTRSAFSGMQRYCFSWTGDSGSEKKMTDSWEQFSYQIPMMLSAGLGGVPFITGDITGYCGIIDDYEAASELYVRWMQFGLFTPLSRAHHEGDTAVEPWRFSDQAMQCAKKAIELKYSLMPYIYTCAREAYDTGLPLMRAMFLEFPDERECLDKDTQFMFGPNLLVAPVVKKGATSRLLYLPEGKWYDWYSGEVFDGGRFVDADAPLDRIPLFVKGGSIVPTMPVLQYTGQNPDADLYIDIYPSDGAEAHYTLYEDDGESLGYQRDCCARTEYGCSFENGVCSINVGERKLYNGYDNVPDRNVYLRIHGAKDIKSVYVNGVKAKKTKVKNNIITILSSNN